MIFVIALNYEEFRRYVFWMCSNDSSLRSDDFNYMSTSYRIRGLTHAEVRLVGHYYQRKDWEEMQAHLRCVRNLILKEVEWQG